MKLMFKTTKTLKTLNKKGEEILRKKSTVLILQLINATDLHENSNFNQSIKI